MANFDVQDDLIKLVRQGMTKTGRSQADLARATGTTTKHVNGVLNGKARASIDMWQRLVDAAHADPPPVAQETVDATA